jgi:hypothetical protein
MPGRSRESIQRELKTRYRNLDELQERQAKFGINAPLDLINQIHDERQAIADLEEELKQAVAETPADTAPLAVDKRGRGSAIQTLDDRDWDNLLRRIKDGNCTPFLGPGLSTGLLPSDPEIAQAWAVEHHYPLRDNDNLPRVAQFLAITRDPAFPAEDIARRWQNLKTRPNFRDAAEAHTFLAGLPLPLYITTNYDDFMFQALNYRLRPATRELCRWNAYVRDQPSIFDPGSTAEISPANPLVYHLFGYAQLPESMVLTEDEYLDFLVNISRDQNIIPRRIQKALVNTSLLFIGYELTDWRFRVLFRGLIASLERSLRRTRVAIQLAPEPPEVTGITADHVRWYFEDYLAKDDVRIYWGSSLDFIKELQQRWTDFNERNGSSS